MDRIGKDVAGKNIMNRLSPRDAASMACSSKGSDLSDEIVWADYCASELGLSYPQGPDGTPCPTYKDAYYSWGNAFGRRNWTLVQRVSRCWRTLQNWLSDNFPEALSTLCYGASKQEVKHLQKQLGVRLPKATKLLYRMCNGQEGGVPGCQLGLIGGYCSADHKVNVHLLSLSQVMLHTQMIRRRLRWRGEYLQYIVVARSTTRSEKYFFLNCADGQLYVGTNNLSCLSEMIPCVPAAMLNPEDGDAMVIWLEEHGRRLHSGIIKVRGEGDTKRISQFPEEMPGCTTAVTNGVKVRASAVLVPENSDFTVNEDEGQTLSCQFFYSIRMSLLPQGCSTNWGAVSSCQLKKIHWRIRANEVVVSNKKRDGVIGEYPILGSGEEEWIYESGTHISTFSGSFEGSITFEPVSTEVPRGQQFKVRVARFPLEYPDYLY